jgi:hypothetical protein
LLQRLIVRHGGIERLVAMLESPLGPPSPNGGLFPTFSAASIHPCPPLSYKRVQPGQQSPNRPPHLVSSHSVTIQKPLWSSTPVADRGILLCARLASPGERMCAPYVFPQCLQTRSARLCAPRWRTSRSMMRTRHVARPATAAGQRRRPPPARILPAGWAPWPRGRSGSVWDACILCAQGGAASALRRGEATMRAGHRRAMQRSAALQPVDGADWHHARASISRSAAPSSRERRAQRAAGCSARHPANHA